MMVVKNDVLMRETSAFEEIGNEHQDETDKQQKIDIRDEIRKHAQHHAYAKRNELLLFFSVDEVSRADGSEHDAPEELRRSAQCVFIF
uniref:hypothetical protein n=1 Tax=Candidatus Electronema sp. TaxID=2698783 RepID=UPI004055AEBF